MTNPATATFKAFAAIAGCKPPYVTALRKAGRLVLTDDGRAVKVAESLARIAATRDPAMQAVADRHAAARGAALATAPTEDEESSADEADAGPDYQQWKARRERAAALREEMRLGEEGGDLIRREEAVAVVSSAFVALRVGLEAMPDSIAPTLASESDEARVRILLGEEVERLLANLSAEIAAMGRTER